MGHFRMFVSFYICLYTIYWLEYILVCYALIPSYPSISEKRLKDHPILLSPFSKKREQIGSISLTFLLFQVVMKHSSMEFKKLLLQLKYICTVFLCYVRVA